MKRIIHLQTRNTRKLIEYQAIFERYGIEVHHLDADGNVDSLTEHDVGKIRKILTIPGSKRAFAVLSEQSNIYDSITGRIIDYKTVTTYPSDRLVHNRTTLRVHYYNKRDNLIEQRLYQAVVPGYIDLRKRSIDSAVFGWDDIFVNYFTGLSYHEMARRGLKLSARDNVIAKFIQDYLYYRSFKNWNFSAHDQKESIDFSVSVVEAVRANIHLNNPQIDRWGIDRFIAGALSRGVFFRAAKNRREAIAWNPGGNAGLPYIAKKDPIHEVTYFIHDIFHFLLPDLIPQGEGDDPVARRVYITFRMMSEAFTLTMADMLFVDTLVQSGYDYDVGKRRIYPLFRSLELPSGEMVEQMRSIFWANVSYCLLGDDSVYRSLGADPEALAAFKEKYNSFFVMDYLWTSKNYDNLAIGKEVQNRWKDLVRPLERNATLLTGRMTISAMVNALGGYSRVARMDQQTLIQGIFSYTMSHIVEPMFAEEIAMPSAQEVTRRGFMKYMMSQLYACVVYDMIPESMTVAHSIIALIEGHIDKLDVSNIREIRQMFDQYIDLLHERFLLSDDDVVTYKTLFPLFPPVYVSYDRDPAAYLPISTVAEKVFRGSVEESDVCQG